MEGFNYNFALKQVIIWENITNIKFSNKSEYSTKRLF